MKIYIVGYMFSGKTTIGKKLARKLGYDFYDLDTLFENHYKISIEQFFASYDENAFRMLETKMLLQTASYDNCVIATGGGTPCFNNNMDFILNNGLALYLESSLNTILQRKNNSKRVRPILKEKNPEETKNFITEQLTSRIPFYEKAHIKYKSESISIDDLAELVQKNIR